MPKKRIASPLSTYMHICRSLCLKYKEKYALTIFHAFKVHGGNKVPAFQSMIVIIRDCLHNICQKKISPCRFPESLLFRHTIILHMNSSQLINTAETAGGFAGRGIAVAFRLVRDSDSGVLGVIIFIYCSGFSYYDIL